MVEFQRNLSYIKLILVKTQFSQFYSFVMTCSPKALIYITLYFIPDEVSYGVHSKMIQIRLLALVNFGWKRITDWIKWFFTGSTEGIQIDTSVNPYLRHFGNIMERHFWTKNPLLFFIRKIFAELFKKAKRCFLNFSKKLMWIFCPQMTFHHIPGLWIFCPQITDKG